MSMRYKGGVISATPPTTTGGSFGTAPGIWTLEQQMQAQAASTWPLAYDPQFNYVTMLLHGDGTNGGQNNTFLDSSTNNFTITRNGNTTQGSFSPYGANWSNFFDAANGNRLTWSFPSSAVQNAVSGTNYTIEFWVYRLPRAGTYQCIFSTENDRNNFIVDSSDNLLITSNGGTLMFTIAANTYIPTNTWTHVALVCSSTTWTLYFNGTSYGTYNSASKTNYATGTAQLGGRNDMNGCGYLSNFRVSTTARYSGAFTPSTAPFTADGSTAMLACQSNRFIDTSSNAQALTVNGSVSVQRFSPFAPSAAYSTATIGGSGYFDGSGDYLTTPSAFAVGSSDFTYELFLFATSFPGYTQKIVTGSGNSLNFSLTGTGDVKFYDGTGNYTCGNITLNTWNHVAVSRVGGTLNLYVNGTRNYSSANSASQSAQILYIGAESGGTAGYFGYISNLRLIVGTGLYSAATITVPTAPLTAITNTSLLLNFTNGSIFDNAMMNDLETVGNAQISTSVKKYGTGSIWLNGQGNEVNCIAAQSNISFGTGDFTIECWMYTGSTSGQNMLWSFNWATGVGGWAFFPESVGGSGLVFHDGTTANKRTWSWSTNTWYHLAVSRSGTSLRLFVDGTQLGATFTNSNSVSALGNYVKIGSNSETNTVGFTGYIDDLRITKGYARYTANFTPPTGPFFDVGPTP